MRWLSPPDKRELLLVLFSLTVFILAYNLEYEHTLRSLGWHMDSEDSSALIGYYGSYLGLNPKGGDIAGDGRKRPPWRDKWEESIFWEWPWFEGHVAEDDKDGKPGRWEGTPKDFYAIAKGDYSVRRFTHNSMWLFFYQLSF